MFISAIITLAFCEPVHGDDAKQRYVAQQGEDRGDCTLPVRPCRTISFALSQAGKGDQIRVASGVYEAGDLEDLLLIASSGIGVKGGFDRFDHFLTQAPQANRTTLKGVPLGLSDQLRDRGFHVIVDRKGIDDDQSVLATYQSTRASRTEAECIDNLADAYACNGVDLLAQVAPTDLSSQPAHALDIWGFVDLNTEREYALLGASNGLAVIDVTDPTRPFEVGTVAGFTSLWRDVKVTQRYDAAARRWRSHAYVSTDAGGRLVVIDLNGLPNHVRLGRRSDRPAHNVYVSNVDYATGVPVDHTGNPPLLQVLGSTDNDGGVRSFDVSDPINLRAVAASIQGYSHDASSMTVTDDRARACTSGTRRSCEVLFDFNENTVELMDFSDQDSPRLLSSTTYDNAGYVHSGWPTEDGRFLFVHDEFDERTFGLNTTVRIFDLADLTNPVHAGTWTGTTRAVDHNGYVRGNRYFMSTYTQGLTILDITDPSVPVEIGHFDTYPVSDGSAFVGNWGVYPFLPSGNLLVSDFTGGLFVLAENTPAPQHGRLAFASTEVGGEEGGEAVLAVVRNNGARGNVSVDYTVFAGSANAYDFVAGSGTLEWPDGAQGSDHERRITVRLVRDRKAEPIERLFVRLENPVGGAVLGDGGLANVFIGDAGRTPTLGFAETRIAVDESAGRVVVTVHRGGSPVGNASVSYEVHSLTAVEDADFVPPSTGELSWQDGDATARTIVIPLVVDDVVEGPEQFEVRLSSPSGAVLADSTAVVEVNAEAMAATGIYLFDDSILQDLLEIRDGATLAAAEFAARPAFRVEVRGGDAVRSVGFAFNGTTEQQVANEPPFVFRPESSYAEGAYEVRATPYPFGELDGNPGQSLRVSFSIRTPAPSVSDDASLGDLSLTGVPIRFDPEEFSYAAVVPTVIASVTVRATPAPGATAVVSPEDADPDRSGHQVHLDYGRNNIVVTVTAEDGTTTRVYDVFVFRGWFNWESR